MKTSKNKVILTSIAICLLILIIVISIYSTKHFYKEFTEVSNKYIEEMNVSSELKTKNDILRSTNEELTEQVEKLKTNEPIKRSIYLTSYYVGDGSSGITTASGNTIEQFQINDKGWFTYNGYIVLATANQTRMPGPIFEGYKSHEIDDYIDFELDGEVYRGIVLDVCGASYGVENEEYQRYDIFTNGISLGVQNGYIYE